MQEFEKTLTSLDQAHTMCKHMCSKEINNREVLRNIIPLKDIVKNT